MKYKELISFVSSFNEKYLDQDVTVKINDDFYRIDEVGINNGNNYSDALDKGHLYLEVV